MSTLSGHERSQINSIDGAGSISICGIIVLIDLDISSEWDLAMLVVVKLLLCQYHVGAVVAGNATLGWEPIQLVCRCNSQMIQHNFRDHLVG